MSNTKRLPSPATISDPKHSSRRPSEKAAAVLALLDDETLASLQGKVAEKNRDRLLDVARTMRSIPKPELKRIAREFAERLGKEKDAVRGSSEIADRISSALFADEGEDDLDALPELELNLEVGDYDGVEGEEEDEDAPIWERVGGLQINKLFDYFRERSPSVFAIAMQNLPLDVVSELSGLLEETLVREAFSMTAVGGKPNPLALDAVEKMLEADLFAPTPAGVVEDEGEGNPNADLIAGILNRLTTKRREKVLDALGEALEGDGLAEIASKVLSFEALEYRVPRNAIPVIFREVEEPTILTALKCAIDQKNPVADYLLANISQRLATGYREKIDEMPSVDEEEGEKAQSRVICEVLEIIEQGRIDLLEPPPEKINPDETP